MDIVITTNSGYPLDQNLYQSVVREYAFRAGQRGQHRFRSAAEPGKEVRLDEAGQDFGCLPQDNDG